LPKKVSNLQKEEILNSFINGANLKDISNNYNFSVATITRQLKNLLGVDKFNEIKNKEGNYLNKNKLVTEKEVNNSYDHAKEETFEEQFVEVIPISEDIDFHNQKELASEPFKEAILPEVLYMLIDKNIELIPKMLKEYPEWSFMPKNELELMTLEVFDDHKYAKKLCTKNQKVIKVNNPKVFLIASNSLKSRGISRIIFNNLLLSL
tara:strand:- start:2731 stop:3351 length:621 start_codon:yes stop_codon:yes gene_type:complete